MIPRELIDTYSKQEERHFSFLAFPINFKMNFRGGWITPTGMWFLPTTTANIFQDVLPKITFEPTYYNLYKSGFVRQDYYQPVANFKFSTSPNYHKKIIFTFDKKVLNTLRVYIDILSIARIHELSIPKPIIFQVNLVSYKGGKVVLNKKLFPNFQHFQLYLNKNRGKKDD